MRPPLRARVLATALALTIPHASALAADAPQSAAPQPNAPQPNAPVNAPRPIPAPPIPPAAKLGSAPAIDRSAPSPPPAVKIEMPRAPRLAPVAPTPVHDMTPADKADATPPPRIGLDAPRPPASSPGASAATIEEITLALPAGTAAAPEGQLARVVEALKRDPAVRLEIRAYTPLTSSTDSKARRLSLARFLAIRDYLVKNGISDDRIDARALGSQPNDANADRVELYIER